jgi:hypothetical protein
MKIIKYLGTIALTLFLAGNVALASSIDANEKILSVGDEALVTVTLTDDRGVPVEDHLVKLMSNSMSTVIESVRTNLSNNNGRVLFRVNAYEAGLYTYLAYDATSDVVLNSDLKIVFYDDEEMVFGKVDAQYGALGNSSGPIDYFEFDDISDGIYTNQSLTFTVVAYDALDQVVTDYDGEVEFDVLSDNANYVNFPEDYEFRNTDLGEHTFSLALAFSRPDEYVIRVFDKDNDTIFGEYIFDVSSESADLFDSNVVLSGPLAGSYNNNVQVVNGSATPGAMVTIFDNDIVLETLQVGVSGQFSYTTPVLPDGAHSFYVAQITDEGTIIDISEIVDIVIDSSGSTVSEVMIEPSSVVDAGSLVNVKLYTSDPLASAQLILDTNIYEMEDNGQGYYETAIGAPNDFGDYVLSFVLIDNNGNQTSFDNEAVLTVEGQIIDDADFEEPDLTVPAPVVIGDVVNLLERVADRQVTLTWDEVSHVNMIANYRVYWGLNPNELYEAIDTFTDSTTWYFPNLINSVDYYFAVIAVDEYGNTSKHFSNIVKATPGPVVEEMPMPDVINGVAGSEHLEGMNSDVSDTGPEILWLVLISAIGGIFYSETAKRRRC